MKIKTEKTTAFAKAHAVSEGARALGFAAALLCGTTASWGADLWDDNDYLVGTPKYLIVLNEDFSFKASVILPNWGTMGSLDWFSDGSVQMGSRYPSQTISPVYQVCLRNGTLASETFRTLPFVASIYGDLKVAPHDQGFYAASIQSGTRWSGLSNTDNYTLGIWGACAVVPQRDGSFELWAGCDEDCGITVTPLAPDGHLVASAELNASEIMAASTTYTDIGNNGSGTMTYDPVGHRVLYPRGIRYGTESVYAVDADTKMLARAYTWPVGQRSASIVIHGVTAGDNGRIVATEFNATYDAHTRSGLNIWDADGSNYRFVDFVQMARDHWLASSSLTIDAFIYLSNPFNILWTGNSPEFRKNLNTEPALTCPQAMTLACVPAAGSLLAITAAVTDPDTAQQLVVALKEGNTLLQQVLLSSPATDRAVAFTDVLLLPGVHALTVEVDDGTARTSCEFQLTLNGDATAPVISEIPANISVTAPTADGAIVSFAIPVAIDACQGSRPVTCWPPSGSRFPIGTTTVTCTSVDSEGNGVNASFTVTVIQPPPAPTSWSGVLQPLNSNGTSIFKTGSVVPVKFSLTGDSSERADLLAYLRYAKISNYVVGSINEADAPGNGTSGNQFKYDASTRQYSFNWSTKGLSPGTYQLNIEFGDGVPRTLQLGLR